MNGYGAKVPAYALFLSDWFWDNDSEAVIASGD